MAHGFQSHSISHSLHSIFSKRKKEDKRPQQVFDTAKHGTTSKPTFTGKPSVIGTNPRGKDPKPK